MRFRYWLGAVLAACTFAAAAAIPATEQTQVVEFYHAGLDHYVIIASPNEISDLDTGVHPGWVRTGYQFAVIKSGSSYPGTSPMCRFYADKFSSHFYTAIPKECDDVKVKFPGTWAFESPEVFRAFVVDPVTGTCPADTTPVFRLWNNRADVNHRYTDQVAAFVFMLAKSYKPEGDGNPALPIAFCTPAGNSVSPAAPASAPNCTVTANTGTPALGATLSLNATCTNSPTNFLWAGCSSTTSACQVSQTTPGSKPYTLYAANAQGPGDPVTINVSWGGGGGGGGGVLPSCTISASSATPTVGTPLTLTANCSQTPNHYDWMDCNYLIQQVCNVMPACSATSATCTVNSSAVGYARYAIAAGNSAGTGERAAVDVEWKAGSGGGPGPGPGPGPDPIPVCNVFASDPAPLVNTSIVLSASCSGNPTSYQWSGVSCAGVQCAASSSAPGSLTYAVTAANAAGSSVAYVTVDWKTSASSPTPACTLSASQGSLLILQTVTITASCTNSPTSYTWTGCSATGPTCNDTVSVAGTKTYTLVASNASGAGSPANVAVNWTAPPTSPPSCQISASNPTPPVGTSVTLTATCSGTPTSYVWTGCTSTTSTCVATSSVAAAVTYAVAGINSFGTGGVAGILVNWVAPGGGPNPGNFCGSFAGVIETSVSWGDGNRFETIGMGNFGSNGVVVMGFTVPAFPASYGTAGYTSLAEYKGPPTLRQATLSESKCDFRDVDPSGKNGPFTWSIGAQVTIDWNVGAPPASLVPGRTYYFNVRNFDPYANGGAGASTCQGSVCNAGFSTNWPH